MALFEIEDGAIQVGDARDTEQRPHANGVGVEPAEHALDAALASCSEPMQAGASGHACRSTGGHRLRLGRRSSGVSRWPVAGFGCESRRQLRRT